MNSLFFENKWHDDDKIYYRSRQEIVFIHILVTSKHFRNGTGNQTRGRITKPNLTEISYFLYLGAVTLSHKHNSNVHHVNMNPN